MQAAHVAAAPVGRDAVTLAELLALRFVAPRLAAGLHARAGAPGQHLSHLHARGMDYAESRPYQPGDDIRVMDWKVTARTGKPHTKLFREERERSLLVVLDTNRSMHFGTRVRFKSVQAARAAVLAAWMVAGLGDRIGVMTFGATRASMPLRAGTQGVLRMAGALVRWAAPGAFAEEPLSAGLQRAARLAPGGARMLVISDGFSADQAALPWLARLRQRTELLMLHVADPLELAAPPAGRYSVENDGQRVALALETRAARDAFAAELGHGRREFVALARAAALPWQTLDTASAPLPAVRALLDGGVRR